MATAREKNYAFSIKNLSIADYDTGEPYVADSMSGGNGTLNIAINNAILEGTQGFGSLKIESWGGNASLDAVIKEAPMEILKIGNQGSLSSNAACACASITSITDKTGTSIGTKITNLAVSGGAHSLVVRDTIYIEALSTTTFKIVNYSKGLVSAAITASGSGRLFDADVAPGIIGDFASAFTTGDTGVFSTLPIHGGDKTVSFGLEKNCASTKYVNIKGTSQNCSDGNYLEFELYKCAISGVGVPMVQGDFVTLTIHADAEIDDSLSTPSPGRIRLIKGA